MELIEILRQSPAAFAAAAGLVGLMVGSFLNVVIHRLPRMMDAELAADCAWLANPAAEPAARARYNLLTPRSACPACGMPIGALQNVPVVSWLVLRGRCAGCRAPISVRYPLVEAATSLLSAGVAWRFGFGWEAAGALAVTWTLVALTGIDLDTQQLPDVLTLPLTWLGLLAAATLGRGPGPLPVDLHAAVFGATFGYLSLWTVQAGYGLLTGREGMGRGDFKLLAALGAWMGWRMLLPIVLLSSLAGAVIGVGMILLRGHDRRAPIPYGPFLAVAGWLAMMFAPELVQPWWPLAR
jgi:leader peptidase (prepilin peptidase)/N-methyltransferase